MTEVSFLGELDHLMNIQLGELNTMAIVTQLND